jgi:hypothetical protein
LIADASIAPPRGIQGLTIHSSQQISAVVTTNQGQLDILLPDLFIDNQGPEVLFDLSSILENTYGRLPKAIVTDGGSGVPSLPLLGSVSRSAPALTGAAVCAVGQYDGSDSSNPCKPIRLGSEIPLSGPNGFYTLKASGVDNVGNVSAGTLLFQAILDGVAPTITTSAVSVTPNGSALFTYGAADNISAAMVAAYFRFQYGTQTIALGTRPEQRLSQFGELAPQVDVNLETPLVTSVQLSQSGGLVATLPGDVINYIVEVVDHAGLRTLADLPKLTRPAGQDARLRGVQTFSLVQPTTAVCNGHPSHPPCPANAATSVDILMRATTPATVTTSPFASAYVWVQDPAAQRFFVEGTSSQPTSSVSGDIRTWTWTIPFRADGYAPQNQAVVFAGGLHQDGNLVLAYPRTLRIIGGS